MENAGLDVDIETVGNLMKSVELTYNAKTKEVVNAYEAGILDPFKVTRVALENALSVASTILTSESVIFEEKKDDAQSMMDMGMGY
jgi:chaperonin GroEL